MNYNFEAALLYRRADAKYFKYFIVFFIIRSVSVCSRNEKQ